MTHTRDNQPHTPLAHAALDAWAREERDLLFNAYFEGDLTPDERAEVEGRLESDESFRQEYDAFLAVVGGLRALPFEFAPDDFVEKVQARIRTRSSGKFFGQNLLYNTHRVPYEVIALVMMIVMAAAYMMMESPRDRGLHSSDLTLDAASGTSSTLDKGQPRGDKGTPD